LISPTGGRLNFLASVDLKLNGKSNAAGDAVKVDSQNIVVPVLPLETSTGIAADLTALSWILTGAEDEGHPLITNPSSCLETNGPALIETVAADASTASASSAYSVTGCDELTGSPVTTTDWSVRTEDEPTRVALGAATGPGSAALGSLTFKLGPAAWWDTMALGYANDRCPGGSVLTPSKFDPANCPAQAQIGTVELTTPLLRQPLTGRIWIVNKTPLPILAFDVGNASASIRGAISLTFPQVDPACDWMEEECLVEPRLTFNLPSVPSAEWKFDFEHEGRSRSNGAALPKNLFRVAPGAYASCKSPNPVRTAAKTYASTQAIESTKNLNLYGCAAGEPPNTRIISGPLGSTTNLRPPFEFAAVPSGSEDTFECQLDFGEFVPCAASWTPDADLAVGAHILSVRASNAYGVDESPVSRIFVVLPGTALDIDVFFTGVPSGTTLDSTPHITFETTGPVVQTICVLDDDHLNATPCEGMYEPGELVDGEHTVMVLAMNGENDMVAAAASFTVAAIDLETTITEKPNNPLNQTSAQFQFETNLPNAGFECRFGTDQFQACDTPLDTSTMIPEFAQETYEFSVRAANRARGEDTDVATYAFAVDSIAPEAVVEYIDLAKADPSRPTFYFSTVEERIDDDEGEDEFPDEGEGEGEPEPDYADESSMTFECRIDDGARSACDREFDAPDALTAGNHTIAVWAKDEAGNIQDEPTVADFEIDLQTASAALQVNYDADETSNRQVRVWSDKPAADEFEYECAVDEGEWEYCELPWEPELRDGAHRVQAHSIDSAGEPVPGGIDVEFTLDATPPIATITAGPDGGGVVGSTAATFEFSGEAVELFECSFDLAEFASCSGPQTYAGLADGAHSFRVRAIDSVGNVQPVPDSREFTVDSVEPETEIESIKTKYQHDNGLGALSVLDSSLLVIALASDSAPARFECRLEPAAEFSPCTGLDVQSGTALHRASLENGTYTLLVRAVDEGGNVDQSPAQAVFSVDASDFGGALDTFISAAGPIFEYGATIDAITPAFRFNSSAEDARFECRIDSEPFRDCDQNFSTHPLADGQHSVEVRSVTDDEGVDATPAEVSFTVAGTGVEPSVSIASFALDDTQTTLSVELGSDNPDASFICQVADGPWLFCDSNGPVSVPADLADGTYQFKARAVAGKVSSVAATQSFSLSRNPGSITIVSAPPATSTNTDATIEFTATAGVSVECALDSGGYSACESPKTYSDLEPGDHVIGLRSVSGSGAIGDVSYHAFHVEGSEGGEPPLGGFPETTITSGPANGSVVGRSILEFTFVSNRTGYFECRMDSGSWNFCLGEWAWGTFAPGVHKLAIRAVDLAGRTDPTPAERIFTVRPSTPPKPRITNTPAPGVFPASFTFDSDTADAYVCSYWPADFETNAWSQWGLCGTEFELPFGEASPVNDYKFRVRAMNSFQEYSPTTTFAGQLHDAAPVVPAGEGIAAVAGHESGAYLRWPRNGSSAFDHYRVRSCGVSQRNKDGEVTSTHRPELPCYPAFGGGRPLSPPNRGLVNPNSYPTWTKYDIRAGRSREEYGGPVGREDLAANTSAFAYALGGPIAIRDMFELQGVDRHGNHSASVVRQLDAEDRKFDAPSLRISGGTLFDNFGKVIGDEREFTIDVQASDASSGVKRVYVTCSLEYDEDEGEEYLSDGSPQCGSGDASSNQPLDFWNGLNAPMDVGIATVLDLEEAPCEPANDPLAPGREICPKNFETTLSFSSSDLSEAGGEVFDVWVEDAAGTPHYQSRIERNHGNRVRERLEAEITIDRTAPKAPEEVGAWLEAGQLSMEWGDGGDDTTDYPALIGSGPMAFEVEYKQSEDVDWIEVENGEDEGRLGLDVELSNLAIGDDVDIRIRTRDRALHASEFVNLTVENLPNPDDESDDVAEDLLVPGVAEDWGDPESDEPHMPGIWLMAHWDGVEGEADSEVNIEAQLYPSDVSESNPGVPLATTVATCFNATECDAERKLDYSEGNYKVRAVALVENQQGIVRSVSLWSNARRVSPLPSSFEGLDEGEQGQLDDEVFDPDDPYESITQYASADDPVVEGYTKSRMMKEKRKKKAGTRLFFYKKMDATEKASRRVSRKGCWPKDPNKKPGGFQESWIAPWSYECRRGRSIGKSRAKLVDQGGKKFETYSGGLTEAQRATKYLKLNTWHTVRDSFGNPTWKVMSTRAGTSWTGPRPR